MTSRSSFQPQTFYDSIIWDKLWCDFFHKFVATEVLVNNAVLSLSDACFIKFFHSIKKGDNFEGKRKLIYLENPV